VIWIVVMWTDPHFSDGILCHRWRCAALWHGTFGL